MILDRYGVINFIQPLISGWQYISVQSYLIENVDFLYIIWYLE